MFVPADPAGAGAVAGDRSVQEKRALLAAAASKMRGFRFASASTVKDDALAPAYYHQLSELYVEAARRLPIAEIPYLANCISIGGLAVGLADPVTNIILTTISAFANRPPSGPCVPPPTPGDALEKTRKKTTFAVGARNSRAGLIMFLLCYFRNLTQDQAKKLLDMAGQSLPLAVLLVEMGCWGLHIPPPQLQPDAARTKTALQLAANSARCSMAGDLVRLMTWRYPRHLLDPVLDDLRAGEKQLTPDCIYKTCDLLRCSWPPQSTPAPTPGTYHDTSGNITTIVQIRKDMFATTTISKDLVTTTTITSTCAINDVGDDDGVHLSTELCKDVVSSSSSVNSIVCSWRENPDFLPLLKVSLLDTVHGFYIDALGMIPSHALRERHLVRSILAAGYCYGPLDPVSNIVVNSIWYDAVFPLSEDVSNQQIGAADILDARSLSRVESRSLDGIVAFVRHTHSISEQQAVVLLCDHRFNLSHILQGGGTEKMFPEFAAAALVAKHPQPAAFGDFLNSLIPAAKLDRLRSLVNDKGLRRVLSGDTLEWLQNMVTTETPRVGAATTSPSVAPDLDQSALETLSAKRETFRSMQDYVRTKLEKLLLDYSRDKGHFYKLGIVCGVATERYGFCSTCYHINFLASRDAPNDDSARSWELFFAEFWSIVDSQVEYSTNVPFCCPVRDSFSSFPIRCGICDQTSCKIAHPSVCERVYFTGNTEYGFPVHHEWGCDLGGMLESDFIYLDRDESGDEFAKILSEESPWSPKKPRAREESTSSQRNTRARTGALAPSRKL